MDQKLDTGNLHKKTLDEKSHAIWFKDLAPRGSGSNFRGGGQHPRLAIPHIAASMAVIHERPPQATSNTEAETAPADMQGTRTIPTTSLCDQWVELSPTQAMGLDGDRAPPGQQGTGPHRPDALLGPPARRRGLSLIGSYQTKRRAGSMCSRTL